MSNHCAICFFKIFVVVMVSYIIWWYTKSNFERTQIVRDNYKSGYLKTINNTNDKYLETMTSESESHAESPTTKIKPKIDTNNVSVTRHPQRPEKPNPKTGLILFTTWVDNEEKELVHINVMNTWQYWKPLVKPLFFYSNKTTGERLKKAGWFTLPVSRTACGKSKMPTIKEMFLDAMANHDSVLYGYANGDIAFDDGMTKAIEYIIERGIVREKPVMFLVRRSNVDFANGPIMNKSSNFTDFISKGKLVTDGSSDGFFTNKLFPWAFVPDVVVARIGIAMWLVSYARAMNVTIIDISKTVRAIHMTTKTGNYESHFKADANCNHNVYNAYKIAPSNWGCGHITCATLEVTVSELGIVSMRKVDAKILPKRCLDCYMNLSKLLPKTYGDSAKIHFGLKDATQN